MNKKKKIRVGLFIDGRYFHIINTYYRHVSKHKRNFDLLLLIKQFQKSIAKSLGVEPEDIDISQRHLYIGIEDSERDYFDVTEGAEYLSAGIISHVLRSIRMDNNKLKEKGVDIEMALDAYALACKDKVDVLAVVTGDADFIPLVHKTRDEMKDFFLFYWILGLGIDYKEDISTSRRLVEEVNKQSSQRGGGRAVNMGEMIEKRNLHIFTREDSPDQLSHTLDRIERSHQGRVCAKNGLTIIITPSNGGKGLQYRVEGRSDADKFITGETVEYNITKEGRVVHLRRTDT